jgi:hypothetical protein
MHNEFVHLVLFISHQLCTVEALERESVNMKKRKKKNWNFGFELSIQLCLLLIRSKHEYPYFLPAINDFDIFYGNSILDFDVDVGRSENSEFDSISSSEICKRYHAKKNDNHASGYNNNHASGYNNNHASGYNNNHASGYNNNQDKNNDYNNNSNNHDNNNSHDNNNNKNNHNLYKANMTNTENLRSRISHSFLPLTSLRGHCWKRILTDLNHTGKDSKIIEQVVSFRFSLLSFSSFLPSFLPSYLPSFLSFLLSFFLPSYLNFTVPSLYSSLSFVP